MIEFGYGWIKDALGAKFAPKTTSTLVINPENGKTIYTEVNELKASIDELRSLLVDGNGVKY